MDNRILKSAVDTIREIKSILFDYQILDLSDAQKKGEFIQLADADDKLMLEQKGGERAVLELIDKVQQLDALSDLTFQDLDFESNFVEPTKIFRIKDFILKEIVTTIELIQTFAVGFEDVDKNYYSLEELKKNRDEILQLGKKNFDLLTVKAVRERPTEITYRKIAYAIASHFYRQEKKFEVISADTNRLTMNGGNAIPVLEGCRHKLLLMKQLGILQFLNEKYYENRNKTQFAKLLALVLGLSSENDIDAIRKEYENILNDTPVRGKGGRPINQESISAVRQALFSIGMKPVDLSEID